MIERKYLWPLLVLGCSLQVNALATEIPANTLVTISMGNGIWPTVNGAEADEVTVAALATHESGFLAVTTTQMGVTFEEPGDYQLWLTGMRLGGTSENATVLHHEFTDRLIWTYNVMAYENFISRPPFVVRSFYALFGDYQVTEFFIARAPVPPPPPPPVPVPEAGSTAALLGMGMLGVGALSRRWRQFLSAAS